MQYSGFLTNRPMLLSVLLAGLAVAKPVTVQMDTNWHAVPYYAHVLETISVHKSSAYFPLLSVYLSAEESDGRFSSEEEASTFLLDTAVSRDFISASQLPIVKAQLANSHRAAYVEAMCQHFINDIVPTYGAEIAECDNVFVYNGKATCEATDVFALETTSSTAAPMDLIDTDHVIGGASADVPWAILYADFNSEEFPVFHANLLASALQQKVSYVLRYKPSKGYNPVSQIGGYAATVQLKRTDYIVVNDRNADGEDSPELKIDYEANVVESNAIPQLDQRAAGYILDAEDQLEALVDTSLNFPGRIADIKGHPINEDLTQDIEANDAAGFFTPGTNVILANGRPIFTTERNVYKLLDVINEEQHYINGLEVLGFSTEQAKGLLASGIVVADGNTTVDATMRYNLKSDAILWLNDVENDLRFKKWKRSPRTLLMNTPMGQFPPIRRNINSIVLAVDFSNPSWLQMLGQLLQILARGAPVQVGVVPITTAPAAKQFVKLAGETGSLIARQMYIAGLLKGLTPNVAFSEALETPFPDSEASLIDPNDVWTSVAEWANKFEIYQPAVFSNGVLVPLSQSWLIDATNQFGIDLDLARSWVEDGELAEDDLTTSLRDKLFGLGISRRSEIVDPINPAAVVYVDPSGVLADAPGAAVQWAVGNTSQTVWLVAEFNTQEAYTQLAELLEVAGTTKRFSVGVLPITSTEVDDRYGRAYAALQKLGNLPALAAINSVEALGAWHHADGATPKIVEEEGSGALVTFASQAAQTHLFKEVIPRRLNLVVDGRLVVLTKKIDGEIIEQLVERERPRALRLAKAAADLGIENSSAFTARLTKAWYGSETSRLITEQWFGLERGIKKNVENAKVDITAIVDPASEIGQELVALLKLVSDLNVASINVLLSPRLLKDADVPSRFYKPVFPLAPKFDSHGHLITPAAEFEGLGDDTLYIVGVDTPSAWVSMAKECEYDLDNILLNTVSGDRLEAIYELKHLLLEGHASDITNRQSPRGVQLVIGNTATPHLSDTMVMANLGYFQLQTDPGFFTISLADGPSSDIYQFNGEGMSSNSIALWITEMDGTTIMPHLVRRPGKETADVLEPPKKKKSWFGGKPKTEGADINIFTVASGHLYERFLSIMTLSVMRHTKHTVKFWLIENFLSPSFKKFLPTLAEEYGFEYEFVTYKWPNWLRGQSEKQREIWGYKILFLDVLFPQNLSKVIFVDSDQIVRTDMIELVNEDLEGAPYGYTPMGDDREEMEGFRFWKQGYWKDHLQGAPYHISALYVVDLDRFRELGAGDVLRQHYQQLSADPRSLSNLDQDLPNNLQGLVKIHSLDKSWLWCETWCSDESLANAKTIDLCNNPLTKEPKLDRARRQIPEWIEYDDAVSALRKKAAQAAKSRVQAAKEAVEAAMGAAIGHENDDHDEL